MIKRLRHEWPYHALLLPGVILTFIFSYLPIYGIIMAFQDYNPGLGFIGSPWVGLCYSTFSGEFYCNFYWESKSIIKSKCCFPTDSIILNVLL